jgi:hypothetical protein
MASSTQIGFARRSRGRPFTLYAFTATSKQIRRWYSWTTPVVDQQYLNPKLAEGREEEPDVLPSPEGGVIV